MFVREQQMPKLINWIERKKIKNSNLRLDFTLTELLFEMPIASLVELDKNQKDKYEQQNGGHTRHIDKQQIVCDLLLSIAAAATWAIGDVKNSVTGNAGDGRGDRDEAIELVSGRARCTIDKTAGDQQIDEPGERERDQIEHVLDEEETRDRQVRTFVDSLELGRLELEI